VDIFWIIASVIFAIMVLNLMWTSSCISLWFGHIIISATQLKIINFIWLYFLLIILILSTSFYFNSREVYDYFITLFSFVYWMSILFCANSIFTTIFIIEVVSSLIFVFLITSTFSTTFFYRNLNLNFGSYFQSSTPYMFIQSIIFFFWMSLIASLNLFIFLILFYLKTFSLDWFILEHIINYIINVSSFKELGSMAIIWLILIFSIFVKCGIAPMYLWKPTFFKGIPFYTLFFYITFFYFFIFLFILNFILNYLTELFFFFAFVNLIFILSGLILLLSILCESFYIKSFMAMSSILNSLFVLLALTSEHNVVVNFWL
jgi:hypothetical protein